MLFGELDIDDVADLETPATQGWLHVGDYMVTLVWPDEFQGGTSDAPLVPTMTFGSE